MEIDDMKEEARSVYIKVPIKGMAKGRKKPVIGSSGH